MKLSVSVPDELWQSSRSVRPDLNPSRLVQEALEAWQERSKPSSSPGRPAELDDLFLQRRDQLAGVARKEFQRGYHAALEAAEVFDWWALESLARDHFDVAGWARGWGEEVVQADIGQIPKDWAPDPRFIGALVKALGNLVPPFGEETFAPSAPYLRGFTEAMRDLWREAFEGWTKDPENDPVPPLESKSEPAEREGDIDAEGGDAGGT